MLSMEERFQIGMKTLERLKPNIRIPTSLKWSNRQNQAVAVSPKSEISYDSSYSEITSVDDIPSLESLLEMTGDLPQYSLILGVCNDGVPLRLDLTNPAPGSMLFAGDPECGKTSLFHAILASTVLLNRPKEVAFSLVVKDPEEYMHLNEVPHLQAFYTTDEIESANLIDDLYAEFRTRKAGAFKYAHMLVIDDLGSFLQVYDQDLIGKFLHLVKHGPRYGMWTLASLSTIDAGWMDEEVLRSFRTHILGYVSDPRLATYLSSNDDCLASELVSGGQFTVLLGGEWLNIWTCSPQPENDLEEIAGSEPRY